MDLVCLQGWPYQAEKGGLSRGYCTYPVPLRQKCVRLWISCICNHLRTGLARKKAVGRKTPETPPVCVQHSLPTSEAQFFTDFFTRVCGTENLRDFQGNIQFLCFFNRNLESALGNCNSERNSWVYDLIQLWRPLYSISLLRKLRLKKTSLRYHCYQVALGWIWVTNISFLVETCCVMLLYLVCFSMGIPYSAVIRSFQSPHSTPRNKPHLTPHHFWAQVLTDSTTFGWVIPGWFRSPWPLMSLAVKREERV